jgi:hypothetical protein
MRPTNSSRRLRTVRPRLRLEPLEPRVLLNGDPMLSLPQEVGSASIGTLPATPPPTVEGADYLIVTGDEFYYGALELAEWKQLKGFTTKVVTMSEVGTTSAELETFLDQAWLLWSPRPTYVLLVGDTDTVPAATIVGHVWGGPSFEWESDQPYACVDDDCLPDLILGRLPVDDVAEATLAINRILIYDRWPAAGDWYGDVLTAAFFQDEDQDGVADNHFMETGMYVHDFLAAAGMTTQTALCHNSADLSEYHYDPTDYAHRPPYPDPVPQSVVDLWTDPFTAGEQVAAAWEGGLGLVVYNDHGDLDGWGFPAFTNDDVAGLANGDMMPVVLSIACSTGRFTTDDECFAEALLTQPGGGAVGVVAAVSTSVGTLDDRLTHGMFDCFYPDYDPFHHDVVYPRSHRPAETLAYAKEYLVRYSDEQPNVVYVCDIYHWFGDPEMMLRTEDPVDLTVAHPASLQAGHPTDVTVSVAADGTPIAEALVCISRPGTDDYWVGETDAAGQVTFSGLVASEVGQYTIVVTGFNCRPYEGSITSQGVGPVAALASPLDPVVNTSQGYIDILWQDLAGVGLDESTIGIGDVSVTGVSILASTKVTSSVWRYHYLGALPEGTVTVSVPAGAILDNAGAPNPAATFEFRFDTQRPQPLLVSPAPFSTAYWSDGYVDILWADPDGSGIAVESIDDGDIVVSGVEVAGSPIYLGSHVWRYYYEGLLPDGEVTVTAVEGQVLDLAGNANAGTAHTFYVERLTAPFYEGWESGEIAPYWQVVEDKDGNIYVGSSPDPYAGTYHLLMADVDTDAIASTNQIILCLDLADMADVQLTFANREWWPSLVGDSPNPFDRIDVSVDGGTTWHQAFDLNGPNSTDVYTLHVVGLDALGLTYTEETLIRFQHESTGTVLTDGIALDEISVTGVPPPELSVVLDPDSDSGISDSDGITNVATPNYLVTVNQAGMIEIDWEGTGPVDVIADVPSAGTYEFSPAAPFGDGPYPAMVTFTSPLGAEVHAYAATYIDTLAPAPPPAPDLTPESDTGLDDNNVTADRTPTFTVASGVATYFRLYRDGQLVSSAPLLGDDGGIYRMGDTEELAEQPLGTRGYTATLVDFAGNESPHSPVTVVSIVPCQPVACHQYADGVLVTIYDFDESNGLAHLDVAWRPADFVPGVTDVMVDPGLLGDARLESIDIYGPSGAAADLGFVIEDHVGLGAFRAVTARAQSVGFIVSDGPIHAVQISGGMPGAVLARFVTEGLWQLPTDIDGDGQKSDPTAILCDGSLGPVWLGADLDGDIVAAGDLASLTVQGDVNGDIVLTGSDIGSIQVRGGTLAGTIRASGSVGSITIRDGNLDLRDGRSIRAGRLSGIRIDGGSALGDGVPGAPDIAAGDMGRLVVSGGGVDGLVAVSDRNIGAVETWGSSAGISNSLFRAAARIGRVTTGAGVRRARRSVAATGADLFNTTIEAARIGTISIDGLIGEDTSDGDLDEIHAWTGRFRIEDLSWSGRVDDGRRFGDRWFGGLRAWVGSPPVVVG